jgi:hypothetical protein
MQNVHTRAKTPRRPARAPRARPAQKSTRARRRPPIAARAVAVATESGRRPRVALALLAVLIAVLLWIPSVRGISPKKTQLWDGYQTLVVRGDRFDRQETAALAARLGPGVVSDVTSAADFWDFTGFTHVTYADLETRLDPLDPRRDSYIDGAKGYFSASSRSEHWRVLYVPAQRTGLRLYMDVARLVGLPAGGEWRLVDFDPLEKAISVLALFGLAILLALSLAQGGRTALGPACAGAALWIPYVLRGGLPDLALALGLLLSWFPLLRAFLLLKGWDGQIMKGIRRPLLVFCAAAAGGLALSLLAGDHLVPSLCGLVSPLACSVLALPAFKLIARVTFQWRKRRSLFEPVPIVRPAGDALRGRSVAPFFALMSLVAVAVVPVARGPSLPTPIPAIGARDFSWQSIQKLSRTNRAMRLPDLSDLVTHEAFQETITFGRPWRLPTPDERVYVREFSAIPSTGAIDSRLRCVKVFDETWRKGLRSRATVGSLEALLFAQGRPVTVALRGSGRSLFRELPVTLGVLLALLALLARDLGLRPLIRSNLLRSNVVARRNQIP